MPTYPSLPLGYRLVLISEDVAEHLGTRTEDGDSLTFSWGEPDETTGVSELVVTRHSFEPPEDEVLFLTSQGRVMDAFRKMYPRDTDLAIEMTRHFMRRLVIPSAQELLLQQEMETPTLDDE